MKVVRRPASIIEMSEKGLSVLVSQVLRCAERSSSLLDKMGYQAKARNEEKGWKCNAIEYAKDYHETEDCARKYRRTLL